jgi:hypothetical protein
MESSPSTTLPNSIRASCQYKPQCFVFAVSFSTVTAVVVIGATVIVAGLTSMLDRLTNKLITRSS